MHQGPSLLPPPPPSPEASLGNRRKGLAWPPQPTQGYLLWCSPPIMLKV